MWFRCGLEIKMKFKTKLIHYTNYLLYNSEFIIGVLGFFFPLQYMANDFVSGASPNIINFMYFLTLKQGIETDW